MTLAERLVAAREHAGFKNQQELADKAKVSQQTISKIESGLAKSSGHIVQIAIACGVRPEWLALEQGEMVDGLYVHGARMTQLLEVAERIPDYAIPDAIARLNDLAKLLERAATQEQPQPVERRRQIAHAGAVHYDLRPALPYGRRAEDKKRSDPA